MDVAVIGAGVAGLAVAAEIARAGIAATVYERGPEVGGLAQSFDLWGHRVDLGSHVLAVDSPAVESYLADLLQGRVHAVPLRRGILIDGRCFAYPLHPADIVSRSRPKDVVKLAL